VSRVVVDPRDIEGVALAARSVLPFHRISIEEVVVAVVVVVVDKPVVDNDKVVRFVGRKLF